MEEGPVHVDSEVSCQENGVHLALSGFEKPQGELCLLADEVLKLTEVARDEKGEDTGQEEGCDH